MATMVFVSAFVWFFIMTPPPAATLQPYTPSRPPEYHYKNSSKVSKKLESYIYKKNPKLPKSDAQEIAYWIDEYAKQEDMDPMLVAALIGRESSFQKDAVSSTGAKGLGQIKDFNFKDLEIEDPFNVQQNVRGTVKYLKHLFTVWKDSNESTQLALASYYQGPNATKKKKDNMPSKVSNYVDDILTSYRSLSDRVR